MSTNVSTHLFWILSRGAGITAMVLASVSVGFGLLMAGRFTKRPAADRRVYHEVLSLSVMVAIAIHGLTLLGDTYLKPTLADISIPFLSSYKTVPTSLGIIAGWAFVALGLSYLRPYADRTAAVALDPPLHAARLDRRTGPHVRDGHRRRAAVVHRPDRAHRRAVAGAARRPDHPGQWRPADPTALTKLRRASSRAPPSRSDDRLT